MGYSVLATIFAVVLLVSDVLVLVMSGVGLKYFTSDIILDNYQVNLKILYGFGIAIGIIEFFGLFLFMTVTSLILNYIITIPLFVLMALLFISFSRPDIDNKYISHYSDQWNINQSKYINFQFKHSCCGYYNYTDRALDICPFDFTNGCSNVIYDYLHPRFHYIFFSMVFGLCMFAVSVVILLISYNIEDEDSIFDTLYFADIF